MNIEIDPSQEEALLAQMQRFAEKWGYTLRISTLDPDERSFDIEMRRADIRAAGIYLTGPGKIAITFCSVDRAIPGSEQKLDEEMAGLEALVEEIPGATFALGKQTSPP